MPCSPFFQLRRQKRRLLARVRARTAIDALLGACLVSVLCEFTDNLPGEPPGAEAAPGTSQS